MKGLPKLDRVTFRFIADPNAALAALKAGDIDASLFGLGPEHVADLKKDARFQVIVGDTTNDVILAMNNSQEAVQRRARAARRSPTPSTRRTSLKGAMFGMGKVLGTNVDPAQSLLRRHGGRHAATTRRGRRSCSPRPAIRTGSRPC